MEQHVIEYIVANAAILQRTNKPILMKDLQFKDFKKLPNATLQIILLLDDFLD